jgi:hypothetical protein
MSPEFWLAIVAQTIVLIITIVGAFVRLASRITKVETEIRHLELETVKIPGISRTLARLEGAHQHCPYWSMPTQPRPEPK